MISVSFDPARGSGITTASEPAFALTRALRARPCQRWHSIRAHSVRKYLVSAVCRLISYCASRRNSRRASPHRPSKRGKLRAPRAGAGSGIDGRSCASPISSKFQALRLKCVSIERAGQYCRGDTRPARGSKLTLRISSVKGQ